ncbi:polysaccharide biosynthesis/export family protein [Desulfococcus sp.]|uniref:polysaccharide biosynthesis/export family protein n=1 Tax=Desulfococcus sp. TaxID=2025834 RepID=UPI003593F4F7
MMTKTVSAGWLWVVSFLVFSVVFCTGTAGAADTGAAKEESKAKEPYYIGSGDTLEIMTYEEPAFTREEVIVRQDGKITFPLLNDLQADGLTPVALARIIESALKKYIENPMVTVYVKDPKSKKFYVLGEVKTTGEYPLTKRLTVLQAFAIAGGFTEWASKKEIILLRNEDGKEKIYRINYRNIVGGKDLSQNFQLQADDTIIVP